jgi:hypothetical protein
MIDEVDRHLSEWVGTVLKGVEVSLGAPNGQKAGSRIGLYLAELTNPSLRSAKRQVSRLALRYLVTASADRPEEAHRLLGELVFAAMENPEFEIDLSPVPVTVWRAFGVAPQPSFILSIPVEKERAKPKAGLVRQPLSVKWTSLTSLHGVVLGPGDVALSGARVEVPGLDLVTHTDYKGRFRFSTVPAEPQKKQLDVKAKGCRISVTTEHNYPESGDPLVIRFDKMEE